MQWSWCFLLLKKAKHNKVVSCFFVVSMYTLKDGQVSKNTSMSKWPLDKKVKTKGQIQAAEKDFHQSQPNLCLSMRF